MSFSTQFLAEAKQVIDGLNIEQIERMAGLLAATREKGGRLFILGVGGSAANAPRRIANAAPVLFSFMTYTSISAWRLAGKVNVNPNSIAPPIGAVWYRISVQHKN